MGGAKMQRYHHQAPPVDLLYLIFSKLDNKNDRDSFGLTCHSFLDIQNSMRKHLKVSTPHEGYVIYPDKKITDVYISKLVNRFTHLQSLFIKSFNNCNVTDLGLDYIARACPLLSVITLVHCYSITDNGLKSLTDSCKLLTQVDLGWSDTITDTGIGYLLTNCRQIRALRISYCDKILGESFRDCSPTLAFLEAKRCAFSITSVAALCSRAGLNYLDFAIPRACPWGHGLGVIGLGGFGKNIKFLDFTRCRGVIDDDIIQISKGCPLLQEWNLSSCDQITLSGWQSVGLYCQNLEILHVNRCICNTGLLALANGCKRLSLMYLIDCHRITSSGISSFKICRQDVELKLKAEKQRITTSSPFTA